MSTRATYEFVPTGGLKTNKTAVYIHYDGYPDGAAYYFWTAMRASPNKGCLATKFIRANAEAELTGGHETHGDTEYRYTIDGANWEAAGVKAQSEHGGKWTAFYAGSLTRFLEKNAKMLEGFDAFRTVDLRYSKRTLNTETARPVLAHAYGHLEIWHANGAGKPGRANWDGLEADVRALCAAFPALAEGVNPEVVNLKATADAK